MCVVEVYLPNWIKKKIRFIQFFLINSGVSLDVSGIDAAVIGFEIGVQFLFWLVKFGGIILCIETVWWIDHDVVM